MYDNPFPAKVIAADLKKAISECQRWGIMVRFVDERVYESKAFPADLSIAPFISGVALSLAHRTIYVEKRMRRHPDVPGALLHEMAHIAYGELPDKLFDEVENGMLALEYLTARRLRLETWDFSMGNYVIAGGDAEWYYADWSQKKASLLRSMAAAEERGMLKDKMPTYQLVRHGR